MCTNKQCGIYLAIIRDYSTIRYLSTCEHTNSIMFCIRSHKQIRVLLVITPLHTGSRDEGSDKDLTYTPDSFPMRSGEDEPTLNEQKIRDS